MSTSKDKDTDMDKEQPYVLRPGVKHSYIDANGTRVRVVGDGKVTIPLSPSQAENFANILVGTEPAKEEVESEKAEVTASQPAKTASAGSQGSTKS